MKKILFVTGTRADFGKIKSLMDRVESMEGFELHVLVTGMHMMKLYGSTFKEVKKQNYKNSYLISNQHTDEPMCSILSNTISIISRLVNSIDPNMIVVHGDRIEALAGATVGALNHIRVCHIEGGELSGTIDDSIRHSITKLSHIHMVANDEAKQRLIQMGENKKAIFIIGSPDLDIMESDSLPRLEDAKNHYDISFDNYGIVMFHPVTSEEQYIEEYTQNLFKVLCKSKKNYVVIYPNNDPGSLKILDVIKNYEDHANFRVFPSINFESFLVLLKNSNLIIGNSSAGVREAPFYGLPSINIGTRQNSRFRGPSVLDCGYLEEEIEQALTQLSKLNVEKSTWFGKGNSTELFESHISSERMWNIPVQKVFVDL
ncbi:UDP-N-acetylglucosamine 2-epimerase (hydrolyzing) [Psychrobacter sp. L7]|uniref:UDP-N-acetylglucosamine 2-epimerase n=1 Tax=Psychrobacter sp. L7 TaxID=1982756 RepID=UPI000C2AB406|nr:UDP-N-acetylglucosamine 2-epimerase [Psychrobacter sp. L7]PJX27112.1 UDP-N-acetylglucosamine 2-epimerase (hydrolyzing) [Psychrobacter sp. L7]